eukprot:CAMPEP_0194779634 /NCGR_PEP_ID=MMETSP0323_2-20130528/71582_1 /TAXON_ID=2866 ORGANISM="Crypthecodinium cohnii, Strain Seligo" /NCGR_SAMPLE_ID=MMETSP0323_2 /ASSEMBLY_ACC=CAM_ASM_000346 /LENGTH=108 /DNA_ID=CAMNT_0039717353 /DNA_START=80 /DNA_END=407 /DNA_ORIENTATION=+
MAVSMFCSSKVPTLSPGQSRKMTSSSAGFRGPKLTAAAGFQCPKLEKSTQERRAQNCDCPSSSSKRLGPRKYRVSFMAPVPSNSSLMTVWSGMAISVQCSRFTPVKNA